MKNNRCSTKPSSGQGQRLELSRMESLLQADSVQNFQKYTKASSLPSFYQIHKIRCSNVSEMYRALSSDNKANRYNSKTKRPQPTHTPERKKTFNRSPFKANNSNVYTGTIPKGRRLVINESQNQRGQINRLQVNNQNSALLQLNVRLRCVKSKLQELLAVRNNESFMKQLQLYAESLTSAPQKKDNKEHSHKEYMNVCFKFMCECLLRREEIKLAQLKQNCRRKDEEATSLQLELKKKTIRAILDQKEVEKSQMKNRELLRQIEGLKARINGEKLSVGVNTDEKQTNFNKTDDSNQSENPFLNTQLLASCLTSGFLKKQDCDCWQEITKKDLKLSEYQRQLQRYDKRQKELVSVLTVLKKQGIDIEKVCNYVRSGKVDLSEEEQQRMLSSMDELRREQAKMYQRLRKIKNHDSFEADNSIVSSIDGLSFDYEDKSLEEDVYTVRHEYKCKQDLGEEMRNRLKLNFDVLYDEQLVSDDYTSEGSGSGTVPTI